MDKPGDKEGKLKKLRESIEKDKTLPLLHSNLVFGEGNAASEILFIGEAPGYYEDKEKRPFVGRSGKLLDKLIHEIGWERDDVYITNIVKRRPDDRNRDPSPEEIAAYTPYLTKQIEIIDPKVISPLGRFAMNYFLPTAKISRDQGKLFWWKNKLIIPLYHPAAALRSTDVLTKLRASFAKLPKALERFDEFLAEKEKKARQGNNKEPEEKTKQGLLL